MRFGEIISEAKTIKLGIQLYAPHPKSTDFPKQVKESFNLKPKAKIWTSTAIQTSKGFTSDWVRWCVDNMPGWVGKMGYIFEVNPNAKILQINSDIDAIKIAKSYGVEINDVVDLFGLMPWDSIVKDYDAVYHVPNDRYDNIFMSTWDVESTAIFNLNILTNKQPVKIDRVS
jgi:hypothetical protein